MRLRTALLLPLCLALAPLIARAEEVDPRYPFSLEASGMVGLGTNFAGFGTSQVVFGGTAAFAFPIAERRQIVLGLAGATGGSSKGKVAYAGAYGGYRMLTYADPWRIRLDLQLAADYLWASTAVVPNQFDKHKEGVGVGGRISFGIQYYFVHNFGAGLEAALAAYALTPHVVFDGGPVLTVNW